VTNLVIKTYIHAVTYSRAKHLECLKYFFEQILDEKIRKLKMSLKAFRPSEHSACP